MKKVLLMLVLLSAYSQAQQFSFQLYFKDAAGNRDTLTLGYDAAATKNIDAAFGEINIMGVPLNNTLDVRITNEWEKRMGGGQATFHTKKQITAYDCAQPDYNTQAIDIHTKNWPVTATWNKAPFTDSCRNLSYFSSMQGDIAGYSDLGYALLVQKDSVTFTTNVQKPGPIGIYAYINNSNDTIPVFFQSFMDSAMLASVVETEQRYSNLSVFPNPAADILSVAGVKQGSNNSIRFFNVYGQQVMLADREKNIDVSGLPGGVYFIQVVNPAGQVSTVRFQKM